MSERKVGYRIDTLIANISNTALTLVSGRPIELGFPVKQNDSVKPGTTIVNQTALLAALVISVTVS